MGQCFNRIGAERIAAKYNCCKMQNMEIYHKNEAVGRSTIKMTRLADLPQKSGEWNFARKMSELP